MSLIDNYEFEKDQENSTRTESNEEKIHQKKSKKIYHVFRKFFS